MGNYFHESEENVLNLFTFGDSVLDCSIYNEHSLDPAKLIIKNDDKLFPEFANKDLTNIFKGKIILNHFALDDSETHCLKKQAQKVEISEIKNTYSIAIITIGGNDLLDKDIYKPGNLEIFEKNVKDFIENLPIRPVFIGSVYDPTFGDDSLNFLGVDPKIARETWKDKCYS